MRPCCGILRGQVRPVVKPATGGTIAATIQTLREWGARRIIVFAVLAVLLVVVFVKKFRQSND